MADTDGLVEALHESFGAAADDDFDGLDGRAYVELIRNRREAGDGHDRE